jgi:creatinine amidohydrolase
MRFGDLTYEEIHERARQGSIAIVPTGCTEQQGPHLPVDNDTWFAEQLTLAASDKCEREFGVHSLVLPVMPFGPTPEHRSYASGYVDVPQELHERLVNSVLESLAGQGFGRIVVWRGCGQHDLRRTIERFNETQGNRARALLPELPYDEIMQGIAPKIPGGHADTFTTSIAMFLRPSAVRRDRISKPHSLEPHWADPHLDFKRYSSTGVIGDPTRASDELGARLWEALIPEVASFLKSVGEGRPHRWLGQLSDQNI